MKTSAIYEEAFRLEAEVLRLQREVAAAEERERRRGVDQCRDMVRSWAPFHPNTQVLIGYVVEQLRSLLDLAPRDSGKVQ